MTVKLNEKDVILSRIIRGMPGGCVGGAKKMRERERERGGGDLIGI